jgi:phytoene dehydrogenase-like protein
MLLLCSPWFDKNLVINSMSQTYDAIIIGAGHNGLVTAAYLARAGKRVCVLERRALIGGAAVTEELFPGCQVSTLSYLCSLLQPQIVNDLQLTNFGYQIYPKDPPFFTAFPDGQHLFFWQDTTKTQAELARFSTADAAKYPAYCDFIERLCVELEATLLQPEPQPSDESLTFCERSARDVLDEWFESPEIKATLATDGIIGYNGGPSTPGTAYNMLHHLMGMAAGQRGLWGFVRGGMGAVSGAIAQAANAHGAVIRTGAEVSQILIKDGQARGVVLASGEELYAPIIVSNAHPQRTFLQLIDAQSLPTDFRARIDNWQSEGVSVKINLLLDGLPNFTAYPTTGLGLPHLSTMHILDSMDYLDRAYDEAVSGRCSTHPMLELGIPTAYDDSLAPAGKHLMSVFAQYAPYTLRDGRWNETTKNEFADRCLATLAEYAPNIHDIVVDRKVISPLDIEQEYGLIGGNIFHGAMSRDQLFQRRLSHRTPIQNLFLCGSGTHPGGGVMGAPGYNAACEILNGFASPKKQ